MAATMISGTKRVAAIGDGEHPVNDVSFFRDTRQKMSASEDSSDTIFECQDGKEVYASRLSLVSPWAWFKDCVSAIPVASSWLRVPLPNIASPALQFILEFLYSGKMPSLHARLNVILAVDIIRACKSKYFELPKVEETAMAYLKSRTHDGNAALELTLAEFASDGGASTASLIKRLSHVWGGVQARELRFFSENALRLWLDNTPSTTPFSEYLRFRKIIVWCATHASPPEITLKEIDAFVPGLREVIAYLQISPSRHLIGFDIENLRRILLEYQSCAASLLENVNFVHIHSVLLDAVVEPLVIHLEVVSEERLREAYKKAYRLNAVPGTEEPPQYAWEHGGQYCTDGIGNGSVITKSEPGMGLARYPVPAFQNHGVYEWTFVVEKPCPGYCELGFVVEYVEIQAEDGYPYGGYQRTLSGTYNGRDNGYCLKITPRTARTNHARYTFWDDVENNFDRLNVRVNFRLDRNKRNCSIAINNGNFFIAWDCLPANYALYFPAVCLGTKTGGQVRIEQLRGFDML